jgi:hypothetical protein
MAEMNQESYLNLRTAALSIAGMEDDPAGQPSLDQMILQTGYGGGEITTDAGEVIKVSNIDNATKSTIDLLDLFVRNFLNSGGRGPNGDLFGQHTRDAIGNLIGRGDITREITLQVLAEAFKQLGPKPYTQGQGANYFAKIKNIADGRDDKNSAVGKVLKALHQFIELLRAKYQGSAKCFSRMANENEGGATTQQHFLNLVTEIATHIDGMGIPLAANFLKDSQLPVYQDAPEDKKNQTITYWAVKPDQHVVALMFWIAERVRMNPKDYSVLRNCFKDSATYEVARRHGLGWPADHDDDVVDNFLENHQQVNGRNASDLKVIGDVWRWAENAKVAPFMIDRLLYMSGSGRFPNRRVRRNNQGFYQEICERLPQQPHPD